MEHLRDEFGENWEAIPVDREADDIDCPDKFDYDTFLNFPAVKGWEFNKDGSLKSGPIDPDKSILTIFLQAWLFFGLISTVVKKGDTPFLNYLSMCKEGTKGSSYVTTENLMEALIKWEKWEYSNGGSGSVFRLISIGHILEMSRRIVRQNCTKTQQRLQTELIETDGDSSPEVDHKIALSIMVLGETLTGVVSRIKRNIGIRLEGWHSDENEGWGPPRYVLKRMEVGNWCPRAVYLLTGQLRSNATMLLAAWQSSSVSDSQVGQIHVVLCSPTRCNVVSGMAHSSTGLQTVASPTTIDQDAEFEYEPRHTTKCHDRADCQAAGPDMEKVCTHLEELTNIHNDNLVNFPLFRLVRVGSKYEIEVTSYQELSEPRIFATISHVWADGLGNVHFNEIYQCQMRFIAGLLRHLGKGIEIPFWLDTLAIPVVSRTDGSRETHLSLMKAHDSDRFDEIKVRAIRLIFQVFDKAEHCVVIDRGLLQADHNGKPWDVTMKILACGWMRRLWTLQEAYMSKKLHFAFKTSLRSKAPSAIDLDEIFPASRNSRGELDPSFVSHAEMARRKTEQLMLGKERIERQGGKAYSDPPALIAGAWHAAHWRTTEKPSHEVLALATLLNLDYKSTEIRKAGLIGRDEQDDEVCGRLMTEFWKLIERRFPGAIPPGIIFLPGQKISARGFGWAPLSWMSATGEDPPYPMRMPLRTGTSIQADGLTVEFPGYLLYCNDRRRILSKWEETDLDQQKAPRFQFPVDKDRLEWYRVEPDTETEDLSHNNLLLEIERNRKPGVHGTDLALLLARKSPPEMPEDVGLYVQISRSFSQTDKESRNVFICNIICRVKVFRTRPPPESSLTTINQAGYCIGISVQEQQRWCVDGPETPKTTESVLAGGADSVRVDPKGKQPAVSANRAAFADPGPSRPLGPGFSRRVNTEATMATVATPESSFSIGSMTASGLLKAGVSISREVVGEVGRALLGLQFSGFSARPEEVVVEDNAQLRLERRSATLPAGPRKRPPSLGRVGGTE